MLMESNKLRVTGHFFKIGNSYYGFDDEEIISVSLDNNSYMHLLRLKNGGFVEEEKVPADFNVLVDNNIFFKKEPVTTYTLVNTKKIGRVSFPTIHECNFKCKYCFASGGDNFSDDEKTLSESKLKLILDFLYYKLFKDYDTIRFDFVSGGEPLLNYGIIQKLNDLTKQYNAKTGKKTFIWVCTNGALLTDEVTEYFEKEHIGLGISFEGTKEMQNLMRPLKDGGETYDLVVKNILNIKNSDKLTGFTKNFWALGVITSHTKSIVELLEAYERQGISNLQLKLCRLPADNEYSIREDSIEHIKEIYMDFSNYLKRRLSVDDAKPLLMILNKNDMLGKYILRILLQTPIIRRCGAGLNKVSICANGDVYPCDSFVGQKDFRIGNIFEAELKSDTKFGNNMTIYMYQKCSTCWARHLCGGDCFHNSYISVGEIGQPLEVFCEIYKFLIELAIDICSFISNLEPKVRRLIEKGAVIRNEYD